MALNESEITKGLFFEHFRLPAGPADLEMLKVVVSHYSALPYENITKIIKKFTVSEPAKRLRSPREVIGGFVEKGTGGTCFSLTYCLGSILSRSGFTCYPVMADMKRPNIHCALVVEMNGTRYIVDPGYLLGEPLELTAETVRRNTPFGIVELRPRGNDRYDLFTIIGGERKWRYRLKAQAVPRSLFIRYWQESFDLPMMNNLLLTRLTDRGYLYVRNHHLRIRNAEEKRNENIRSELDLRVEREFGIPGELVSEAREYLERLKESWRIQRLENRRRQSL